MLHLKRKVRQAVMIGDPPEVTITVQEVDCPHYCLLEIADANSVRMSPRLRVGQVLRVAYAGEIVKILCDGLERGEAWLTFDAPRSVLINRPERVT